MPIPTRIACYAYSSRVAPGRFGRRKENKLKQRLSRRNYARAATLLVLVASLAFAAVAMGGPTSGRPLPGTAPTTVFISAQGGLHFVAPKTIENGQELTVINQTN